MLLIAVFQGIWPIHLFTMYQQQLLNGGKEYIIITVTGRVEMILTGMRTSYRQV
jgi:hypothetical protein